MIYGIELKPRAIRDLKAIDKSQARRIIDKIGLMKADLAGDSQALDEVHPRIQTSCWRLSHSVRG